MSPRLLCCWLVLTAVWGAGHARAAQPTVQEQLAHGRALLDDLDYEEAADELMLAAGREDATEAERFEANLYAGIANRVLDRNVEARLHFFYVLSRQPDYALPADAPPKIRTFFDLVQQEVKASGAGATPATAASAPPTAQDASTSQAAQAPPRTSTAAEVDAGGGGVLAWSMLTGGGVLAALAVVGLVAGGVAAAGGEVLLSTPEGSYDDRALVQLAGRAGLLTLGVGAAGLLLSGALLAGGALSWE